MSLVDWCARVDRSISNEERESIWSVSRPLRLVYQFLIFIILIVGYFWFQPKIPGNLDELSRFNAYIIFSGLLSFLILEGVKLVVYTASEAVVRACAAIQKVSEVRRQAKEFKDLEKRHEETLKEAKALKARYEALRKAALHAGINEQDIIVPE